MGEKVVRTPRMVVQIGDGGPMLDISDAAQMRRIVEVAYMYVLGRGYIGTAATLATAKLALEAELRGRDNDGARLFLEGLLEARHEGTAGTIRSACALFKLGEPD